MKAIETFYDGHRFRSRLEARWAVYFNAVGISYEYEPEGFELSDGTKYLPDFYLPDENYWIEIKPVTEDVKPVKFYFAGKIEKSCWRHSIVPYLRGAWWNNNGPIGYPLIDGHHEYVGPFFSSCDHGCFHRPSTHASMENPCCASNEILEPKQIVGYCIEAINKSDIIFAWIDDPSAYASLVEIGFATNLKKEIWLGIHSSLEERWFDENQYTEHCPDIYRHEFWFIADMIRRFNRSAMFGYFDSAIEAFSLFYDNSGKKPKSYEYFSKLLEVAKHKNGTPILITGSPGNHKTICNLFYYDRFNDRIGIENARSARFEYGESG